MSEVPTVRARHMKGILARVDGLAAPRPAAIRSALEPASLREIEHSIGLEWLPFELNLRLTRGVYDALGPAATHEFWRGLMLADLATPIFKSIADAAIAIFGLDPGSWARWVPRAWALVFRHCGEWTVVSRGPAEVMLRVTALPAACLADEIWISSVASSLSALVDMARTQGTVRVDALDQSARAADLVLRWERGPRSVRNP